MSEIIQNSDRLDPDQAKGEVERVRTVDGSSEVDRVGVHPHCVGETRNVTTENQDVLNSGSLLPEVLLLPPPNRKSGENAAQSKMHAYIYHDQIWVYSAL